MSEEYREQLGALIQDYIRAKWADNHEGNAAAGLDEGLSDGIRERVDILGYDGERLLTLAPVEVLAALEGLEREAAQEDARVATARAHIQKEASTHNATHPLRRDQRAHPGQPRKPAKHGHRRQRNQR